MQCGCDTADANNSHTCETHKRIADLETIVRRYHDWHMRQDDSDEYLDSGMYEDAAKALPGLAAKHTN